MSGINDSMRLIRQLVGNEGIRVFEKNEFLSKVRQLNDNAAKNIEKLVEEVTNPTFEVTGKAAANYNIASLKIKNGNEVIGSGSASISFKDVTKQPEIKSRLNLRNGEQSRGELIDDKFKIVSSDKDGKIVGTRTYSVYDGSLIQSTPIDTNIVIQSLTKSAYGKSMNYYNKKGEAIITKTLMDDGNISIIKKLKDGSRISITKSKTGIYLRQYRQSNSDIIMGNNGEYIYISMEGTSAPRNKDLKEIIFDKNFNIIKTCPQKCKGQTLSKQFIEKYGLEDILDAYKNAPQQIKEVKELFGK